MESCCIGSSRGYGKQTHKRYIFAILLLFSNQCKVSVVKCWTGNDAKKDIVTSSGSLTIQVEGTIRLLCAPKLQLSVLNLFASKHVSLLWQTSLHQEQLILYSYAKEKQQVIKKSFAFFSMQIILN